MAPIQENLASVLQKWPLRAFLLGVDAPDRRVRSFRLSMQVRTGPEYVAWREDARVRQAAESRAAAAEFRMRAAQNDARAATAARPAAEQSRPEPEAALDALPKPCELAH